MGENITLETLNVYATTQANHWLYTAAAYNHKKHGALKSLNIPGLTTVSENKIANFSVSTYDMVKFYEGDDAAKKITGDDLEKKWCFTLESMNLKAGLGKFTCHEQKSKQADYFKDHILNQFLHNANSLKKLNMSNYNCHIIDFMKLFNKGIEIYPQA